MSKLAFPRTAFNSNGDIKTFEDEFQGMTLRDYFAAKALQAIIDLDIDVEIGITKDFEATEAYQYADAMLKAREY